MVRYRGNVLKTEFRDKGSKVDTNLLVADVVIDRVPGVNHRLVDVSVMYKKKRTY